MTSKERKDYLNNIGPVSRDQMIKYLGGSAHYQKLLKNAWLEGREAEPTERGVAYDPLELLASKNLM